MLDGCDFNEGDGLYIRLKQANVTFVKAKSFAVFLSPVWFWHVNQ